MNNPRIKGSLLSRYEDLARKREPYLNRAKAYAKITLPYLLGDDEYGRDENDINTSGWQSFGAQAVNHLSNKVVMTLFPPSRTFFKLSFESSVRRELREQGYDSSLLAEQLTAIEQDCISYMESTTPRDMDIRTLKHLIVTGNFMHYFPEKRGKAIGVPLTNFVVRRDSSGNTLEVLIRQKKALVSLTPEQQAQVLSNPSNRNHKDDHEFDLITSAVRMPDGKFEIKQECGEVAIGAVYRLKEEDLPFTALRWNYADGESYGRGLVEDHASDWYVIQMLSEAIAKGMVLMADVKYLVKAGSYTDIDHLLSSPTGEFIEGDIDDIGVLQLDKYADFTPIANVLEKYERRIGQVFLMNSAVRRDAERITAYEIRQDAAELETSLGGIYSALADGWQRPRARRLLRRALQESTADLRIEDFDPQIVTGVEALGRMNELDKIIQLTEVTQMTHQWPENMQGRVNWDKFLGKVAAEIGLELDWLTSEEEYQKKQQEQQQAQQEQMMLEQAAKAAPQMLKGGM